AMLAAGFKGVAAADVLASPADYFINNYWAEADVTHYGHIAGAYRIKENLTLAADGFKHLDPSKTIVTYCWTGQTSSIVTAYLTVLGFDAKSLKFGTNGMIHSQLESHKWEASADYDYVTGP
ncbi:rhodanese-like domain-containing protein, partial [bacterium]|nr:rhodanese-like domain-containing protein [bacterium]